MPTNITRVATLVAASVLISLVVLTVGGFSASAAPWPPAPAFSLLNQDGQRVDTANPTGQTTILTFLYTSCTTTCPTYTNKINLAIDQLDPEDRGEVDVLAVTVDPERDTPERLKEFATHVPKYWQFLTETRGRLQKVWGDYGVFVQRKDEGSVHHHHHGYEVIHTGKVVVIDGRGYIRAELQGEWETTALVAALKEAGTDAATKPAPGRRWAPLKEFLLRYAALCERVASISWLGAVLSLLKQAIFVAGIFAAVVFLWRPAKRNG